MHIAKLLRASWDLAPSLHLPNFASQDMERNLCSVWVSPAPFSPALYPRHIYTVLPGSVSCNLITILGSSYLPIFRRGHWGFVTSDSLPQAPGYKKVALELNQALWNVAPTFLTMMLCPVPSFLSDSEDLEAQVLALNFLKEQWFIYRRSY